MSFQISPELDANKVFLVRSSELEGRLDPAFNLAFDEKQDSVLF